MFSKIAIDQYRPRERACTATRVLGLLGVDIFWLRVVPKENVFKASVFLSLGSEDAGTTLRFAGVELGLKPSQGKRK